MKVKERIIVVGDVHGCLEELDELLKTVEHCPGDRLVFLGDLVDRGPDPVGCVRRARELHAQSVLGNHEEKVERWRRHERIRKEAGKPNPMSDPSPGRRAEWEALSDEDLVWIRSLPAYIGLGDGWLAVHAGFEPGVPFTEQKKSRMIRVRYVDSSGEMVPYKDGSLDQPPGTAYWAEVWTGPQSVVYGHAVHSHEMPRTDSCGMSEGLIECVGIDTGCVFGGRLTALLFHPGSKSRQVVQVQAKRQYHRPLKC